MEHIVVVAFLVSCSTNLTECRQLPTDQHHWLTPSHCEAALPRLKRHYQSFGYSNIMAKCHYLLDEKHRYIPVG